MSRRRFLYGLLAGLAIGLIAPFLVALSVSIMVHPSFESYTYILEPRYMNVTFQVHDMVVNVSFPIAYLVGNKTEYAMKVRPLELGYDLSKLRILKFIAPIVPNATNVTIWYNLDIKPGLATLVEAVPNRTCPDVKLHGWISLRPNKTAHMCILVNRIVVKCYEMVPLERYYDADFTIYAHTSSNNARIGVLLVNVINRTVDAHVEVHYTCIS